MTIDANLTNAVLKKINLLLERLESSNLISNNSEALARANLKIQANAEDRVLRWVNKRGFIPVKLNNPLSQNMLLHVEHQANILMANTKHFVEGYPANNALLWGARGTGKSSLIQAVLAKFTKEQLRIIEIRQQDFSDWIEIVEWIQANHEQKFIIFCDDLSFNENDSSYREVKAALDGSLTSLPENALLYASSNRRHLLPEKLADNQHAQHINGEIHHAEAIEEIISLSDRFGLWLSFHALTQNQYLDIVQHWLKEFGVNQPLESYKEIALRWSLQRGSRSGRIANQFARDYAGQVLTAKKNN